jgi:hypothetical protein
LLTFPVVPSRPDALNDIGEYMRPLPNGCQQWAVEDSNL